VDRFDHLLGHFSEVEVGIGTELRLGPLEIVVSLEEDIDDIVIQSSLDPDICDDSRDDTISSHDPTMHLEDLFSTFLDMDEGTRTHDTTDLFDTDILDLAYSLSGDTIGISDLLKSLSLTFETDTTSDHGSLLLSE
jgi:hypothetical protein